jgi:DNA repair exonuclease SbcCD ATPase subunit
MSKFFIDSTSQSTETTPAYVDSPSYGSDDEDTLPYPAELARNDFLAPDFDAQTYLSSLRNRHQTLEDLRSDLRQRSQLLNRELLDLVNGNYEEFLSLGGDLKGGEEKVEGVRVGLLGFQREVEGIRKAVQDRARETGELLREKKGLRKEVRSLRRSWALRLRKERKMTRRMKTRRRTRRVLSILRAPRLRVLQSAYASSRSSIF